LYSGNRNAVRLYLADEGVDMCDETLQIRKLWLGKLLKRSGDGIIYNAHDPDGEWGTAWRETDVEDTDLESVIIDLLEGQYINPVRVVGFNVSQGWVRDVSEDVVRELRQRCADQDRSLPDFLQEFVVRYQTAKNMGLR
jgi:hypothetical protein